MNLGELRSLTRTYLNEPFAAFWSDAELNKLLNVGCQRYHAKIKNVSRNHFTTRVTFPTVANQGFYQLPTNCKDLRLVSVVGAESEDFLEKANWPNPDRWTDTAAEPSECLSMYYLIGKSIRFVPAPSSVVTIRLYYEARQVALVADSDAPTFEEDYHDLAAKWAAIEAAMKQKERRPDLADSITSREQDLIQDVYHRVNAPVLQAEGYLE